jgi:hypothetical protein
MSNVQTSANKVTKVINTKVVVAKPNESGKALEKRVIVPSALVLSKRLASANNKAELSTLSFQLNQAKKHATNFVTELQAKYNLKVSLKDIENLAKADLTNSSVFNEFLTEKMQLAINEKGWSFAKVLTLTANYFKAKATK